MESGDRYPWYGLTVGDDSHIYNDFKVLTGESDDLFSVIPLIGVLDLIFFYSFQGNVFLSGGGVNVFRVLLYCCGLFSEVVLLHTFSRRFLFRVTPGFW